MANALTPCWINGFRTEFDAGCFLSHFQLWYCDHQYSISVRRIGERTVDVLRQDNFPLIRTDTPLRFKQVKVILAGTTLLALNRHALTFNRDRDISRL